MTCFGLCISLLEGPGFGHCRSDHPIRCQNPSVFQTAVPDEVDSHSSTHPENEAEASEQDLFGFLWVGKAYPATNDHESPPGDPIHPGLNNLMLSSGWIQPQEAVDGLAVMGATSIASKPGSSPAHLTSSEWSRSHMALPEIEETLYPLSLTSWGNRFRYRVRMKIVVGEVAVMRCSVLGLPGL